MSDVKNFTPIDVALLRRLASRGMNLDTLALVQDINPLETALLGAVGLNRGYVTYVLRTEHIDYAAQIAYSGKNARLMFVAPAPRHEYSETAWLSLVESLLQQVGRREAHLLTAEVPLDDMLTFELFRLAGFTVYAREVIYHLDKTQHPITAPLKSTLHIRPVLESDFTRIQALYANTVPRMLRMVDSWAIELNGWVILMEGEIRGYVGISEGRQQCLLQPYFHPELYDSASEAMGLLLEMLPHRKSYVRLYIHQEWLRGSLEQLGFEEWQRFALVGRHTIVRASSPLRSALLIWESKAIPHPVEMMVERLSEITPLNISHLTEKPHE